MYTRLKILTVLCTTSYRSIEMMALLSKAGTWQFSTTTSKYLAEVYSFNIVVQFHDMRPTALLNKPLLQ